MPDSYAVIGNPIAQSKSPPIHAAFAASTGQDMVYDRILAPLDGFAAAVEHFAAGGGRGLNVTAPFKLQAFAVAAKVMVGTMTRSSGPTPSPSSARCNAAVPELRATAYLRAH